MSTLFYFAFFYSFIRAAAHFQRLLPLLQSVSVTPAVASMDGSPGFRAFPIAVRVRDTLSIEARSIPHSRLAAR
jgi:hypothetical protein